MALDTGDTFRIQVPRLHDGQRGIILLGIIEVLGMILREKSKIDSKVLLGKAIVLCRQQSLDRYMLSHGLQPPQRQPE